MQHSSLHWRWSKCPPTLIHLLGMFCFYHFFLFFHFFFFFLLFCFCFSFFRKSKKNLRSPALFALPKQGSYSAVLSRPLFYLIFFFNFFIFLQKIYKKAAGVHPFVSSSSEISSLLGGASSALILHFSFFLFWKVQIKYCRAHLMTCSAKTYILVCFTCSAGLLHFAL